MSLRRYSMRSYLDDDTEMLGAYCLREDRTLRKNSLLVQPAMRIAGIKNLQGGNMPPSDGDKPL